MVRPERLRAEAGDDGSVEATEYYGHDAVYRVRMDDGCMLRARIIGPPVFGAGDRVTVDFTGPPTMAYGVSEAPLPSSVARS